MTPRTLDADADQDSAVDSGEDSAVDSAVDSRGSPADRPTRVLLDTNALMMPVECDVRLFDELDRLVGGTLARGPERPQGKDAPSRSEGDARNRSDERGPGPAGYECIVPVAVADELERLADPDAGGTGGAEARAARVGLDLLDRCSVVEHDAEYADDAVLELAGVCEYVVTNDRPLAERLRAENGPVIRLRGRTKLEVTES